MAGLPRAEISSSGAVPAGRFGDGESAPVLPIRRFVHRRTTEQEEEEVGRSVDENWKGTARRLPIE